MCNQVNRLVGWLVAVLLFTLSFSVISQNNPSLLVAAKEQDWQKVTALLNSGNEDVNATQEDGATALAWAVHWDHRDTVERLLEAGADPGIGNDYGITPLFLAAKNRSISMVKTLLEVEGGADPNTTLWSGETLLMTAARSGFIEVVEVLLEHGADLNVREPRRDQSALMWAIAFGHPDTARLLIEHGAEVNAKTKMLDEDFTPMVLEGYTMNVDVTPRGGYTPMTFAARVGDRETAKLLLERGADVNGVYNDHGPPLVIAAAAGYEELALFLLEHGADPNLTDVNGMTALHYAMRDGLKPLHNIKITGKTVEQDKDSLLPGGNMYKLAEALLEKGGNPNAGMKYPPPNLRVRPSRIPRFHMGGATPLLLASSAQDIKGMKMLLEAGADPLKGTKVNQEILNEESQVHSSENQMLANATPLMAALGMGRRNKQIFSQTQQKTVIAAAKMLINKGADINEATASGWTPLHAAAFIGANTLVEFLVQEGAKINVKNGCNQTPLSLALRASTVGLVEIELPSDIRQSTAELLIKLGADDKSASGPVGECVLGRAGLEVERDLQKEIRVE
jgi:ankyrin repeat protein